MENRNITCSYFGVYGTPFHAEVLIDYDDGETLSGCYDHSGYVTLNNNLPIFTVGGVYEYGQPAFFAQFDSSLNESVWTFGLWTNSGSLIEWYCIDAYAEHDLSHPGIVRQWNCWDEATQAHTNEDYLITTCCRSTTVTPSPATSSASASPTTSMLAPVATLAPATPPVTPITPAPATPFTPPPTKRLTPSPLALWTSAPVAARTMATTSPSSDGSVAPPVGIIFGGVVGAAFAVVAVVVVVLLKTGRI